MDYNLFKQIVVCRIKEFLPPVYADYEPVVEKVEKVNETKEAMIMKPENQGSAQALPMIYLDDMYVLFREGQDLDEVMKMIAGIVVNFTGYYRESDVDIDFSEKKDCIIMNLVNTEMNQELLKAVPHIEFNNMSVIFRIIVNREAGGFNSVIINDSIFNSLKMTKSELIAAAKENTRNIFPEHMIELDEGVVIITNEANIFGSVNIMYSDIMEEVGEMIGDDIFYIFPCSIHEVLAISREAADVEKLISMLADGNGDITSDKDILSNCIYQYNCHEKTFRMVASYRKKAC